MKLGIPWRVKGISPDMREPAWETAHRSRHVGERIAQPSDPRLRNDQLFAVYERINELTRQLERLHQAPAPYAPYPAPAQGPAAYAPLSYNDNRDHHFAAAIIRLERRMDELVKASRDIPAAPVYAASVGAPPAPADMPEPAAPAPSDACAEDINQTTAETPARQQALKAWTQDIEQTLAEIAARQQALNADADAPACALQDATAEASAPVELEAPAQAAAVPEQDLSGLEQQLRAMTSQIETLRQQPQGGEVLALAFELDNSRDAGDDTDTPASTDTPVSIDAPAAAETFASAEAPAATDAPASSDARTSTDTFASIVTPAATNTPASIERGLAEIFEALCSGFSKPNAAYSLNELAGQTAIIIAACPVPGAATVHHGP